MNYDLILGWDKSDNTGLEFDFPDYDLSKSPDCKELFPQEALINFFVYKYVVALEINEQHIEPLTAHLHCYLSSFESCLLYEDIKQEIIRFIVYYVMRLCMESVFIAQKKYLLNHIKHYIYKTSYKASITAYSNLLKLHKEELLNMSYFMLIETIKKWDPENYDSIQPLLMTHIKYLVYNFFRRNYSVPSFSLPDYSDQEDSDEHGSIQGLIYDPVTNIFRKNHINPKEYFFANTTEKVDALLTNELNRQHYLDLIKSEMGKVLTKEETLVLNLHVFNHPPLSFSQIVNTVDRLKYKSHVYQIYNRAVQKLKIALAKYIEEEPDEE